MRRDPNYLEDIVRAADKISEFVTGRDLEYLRSNELLQSALAFQFIILGEAASRVTSELRERYPTVAWNQARGIRNVIVHEYFGIKWDVVWTTATVHVPLLRAQMVEVFKAEFPDDTLEL